MFAKSNGTQQWRNGRHNHHAMADTTVGSNPTCCVPYI